MSAKYIRLANHLKELIEQNEHIPGYKLPSENTLCQTYHLSRQTVRLSLQLLEQEGLIEKRRGSGSFATGLGQKHNTIALLVNEAEEYTSPALISDIKSVLRPAGYTLEIHSMHSRFSQERKILEELSRSSIRGLIAEGCRSTLPNPNLDLYQKLLDHKLAVLFLNSSPALSGISCIQEDDFYGGYLLGKHLIQNEHTHIAAVFRLDDLQGTKRCHGFLTALRDFSIPYSEDAILWYTSAELEALERRSDTGFLTAHLHKIKDTHSAVICHNDEIAYYLIREMRYAGIRVPEDMSVVSFDNSYMSELDPIRITSLSHKPHELGATAASCLLDMIQGRPISSHELSWQLIKRISDAPRRFGIPAAYSPASF